MCKTRCARSFVSWCVCSVSGVSFSMRMALYKNACKNAIKSLEMHSVYCMYFKMQNSTMANTKIYDPLNCDSNLLNTIIKMHLFFFFLTLKVRTILMTLKG